MATATAAVAVERSAPPKYAGMEGIDFKQIFLNGAKLYNIAGALPDLQSTLTSIEGSVVELNTWSTREKTLKAQIKKDEMFVGNILCPSMIISFIVASIGSLVLGFTIGLPGAFIALGTAALIFSTAFFATRSRAGRAETLKEFIAAADRQLTQ